LPKHILYVKIGTRLQYVIIVLRSHPALAQRRLRGSTGAGQAAAGLLASVVVARSV